MVQNSALDPIRGSGIHMAFFILFEGWFRDPPNVLAYSITDQQEESRGLIVGWDEIHVSTKSNIGWRVGGCFITAYRINLPLLACHLSPSLAWHYFYMSVVYLFSFLSCGR